MTVTNSVNLFGIAPSNKWNDYNWNAFLWGEGTADLITETTKVLGNTITGDTVVIKEIDHVLGDTLTLTEDITHRYVLDGAYYRVYTSDTTDIEGEDTVSWSSSTATAPTWASATAASTSWS